MNSVRLLASAVALALGCSSSHAAAPAQPVHAAKERAAAKRGAEAVYIVTFSGTPLARQRADLEARFGTKSAATGAALKAHANDLRVQRHERLAAAATLLGRSLEPLFVYEHANNGVALRLSEDEARRLATIPGVRRVQRERWHRLSTDKGPAFIGAPAIWNGTPDIANRGEGIVIGVVDTGIHASHPAFAAVGPDDGFVHANPRGERFGLCASGGGSCNDKLIGMYDFTSEGTRDGSDVDGHGTHVASTAAGNHLSYTSGSQQIKVSGVAPHASIISYKACVADDPDTDEDEGGCPGSATLAAVNQATADGVDVINYSIGGGSVSPWICFGVDCDGDGDTTDLELAGEAFLSSRAAGIVAVVAAGNDGPDPVTVHYPGLVPWVLTVAAINHDRQPSMADVLARFSSRGPAPVGGFLVPDVSAPGVNILAADNEGTGAVYLSGTSMATPHVAGAAALLLGAHPEWKVDAVASALVGTARPDVIDYDFSGAVDLWAQGAGVVDLAKAVKAGLSFEVTPEEYEGGDPEIGGVPSALNEPSMVIDPCFRDCVVLRRVTDLVGGGTWRVEATAGAGLSVAAEPSQFTLAAGATQEVRFTLSASDIAGEWSYGEVRFVPVSGTPAGTPTTRLPMAVFSSPGELPDSIVIEAATDAGFVDVPLEGLVDLPQASFASTGFGEVTTDTRNLREDPTNGDPYDAVGGEADGAFQVRIPWPANSGKRRLVVRTSSPTSNDVDLFVGQDSNLNGLPSESEMQCASTTPDATESCELQVLNLPVDVTYWILVQNWDAGSASDAVTLEYVLADDTVGGEGALTVTGPGHVEGEQPFTVRLAWEDFTLAPGDVRQGSLLLGTTPDRLGATGSIPVILRRSSATTTAPHALQPGEPLQLRLRPGEAEDRLYVDVPPNASALTVSINGSGEVDLHAAHLANASGPVIAAAPARDAAVAHSTAAGAHDSLTVSGAQLTPGRWYLTPVNTGSGTAEFSLTMELAYDSARAQTRGGAFFNPERSGAGGFLYPAGGAWAFIWYTFLQDGTPTWYLGATAEPGAQQGTVVIPLDRYSWDGSTATAHHVGEAVLSLKDATTMRFSWNLDGESGSEVYQWIDGGGCPTSEPNDLTGSWYAPALSGYGYSVNAYAALESNAAYFYDGVGVGRWAFGGVGPFGGTPIMLEQFSGAGPLQPYVAPTRTQVGSYDRTYSSESSGQATLDVTLVPPLSGTWTTSHAIQKLTDALGCD